MIQFEHLTIASVDPVQTRADYAELLGLTADDGGSAALRLDNIELRFSASASGASPGIEAVGLVGRVDDRIGRWSLGSQVAATATAHSEVPFEPDESAEAIHLGSAVEPSDPAAIHAVDHIVIRSRDVDATRRLFEESFGLRVLFDREFPEWKVRLCMCRIGDAVLEIAGSLEVASGDSPSVEETEKEGVEKDRLAERARDRLWGVTWRVRDIEAAHQRLAASGFDLSEVRPGRRPGTHVFTVRNRTGGVPTLVIQPTS